MRVALIEPYLVDYRGYFYNFVTELNIPIAELDGRSVPCHISANARSEDS